MKRVFILDFHEPSEGWMKVYNLKYALEQICINTKFDVFEISISRNREIDERSKLESGERWNPKI